MPTVIVRTTEETPVLQFWTKRVLHKFDKRKESKKLKQRFGSSQHRDIISIVIYESFPGSNCITLELLYVGNLFFPRTTM